MSETENKVSFMLILHFIFENDKNRYFGGIDRYEKENNNGGANSDLYVWNDSV